MRIEGSGKIYESFKAEEMVQMTINADGSITGDRRRSEPLFLKQSMGVIGAGLFRERSVPKNEFRTSFGDYWSMDIPTRGTGWGDATWDIRKVRHRSLVWANEPKTYLQFDLEPASGSYLVQLEFTSFGIPKIGETMKLSLNGHELRTSWPGDLRLVARIPAGLLLARGNVLEISAQMKPGDYGYALDSIHVLPD